MQFFTVEKLGERQSVTPEGFLLCREVPIARTGTQKYHPEDIMSSGDSDDVEVQAGADGFVYVERLPEEVFRTETIESFNGKSVVVDHPVEDITPASWNELTVGVTFNVRQQSDLLVADLLLTNPLAIDEVRSGRRREISCGYDFKYVQLSPGKGRQVNIVGNHVALVESGRCGSQCRIQDTEGSKGEQDMTVKDRILQLFKARDEEGLKKELEKVKDEEPAESAGGGSHIHVHNGEGAGRSKYTDDALEKKFQEYDSKHAAHDTALKAHDEAIKKLQPAQEQSAGDDKEIEGNLEMEAPAGSGDSARKAKDSVYLQGSFQDSVAAAEIIQPGIALPSFVVGQCPRATFKVLDSLRRKALQHALQEPASVELLRDLRRMPLTECELNTMKAHDVRALFNGLAAVKRVANRGAGAHDGRVADMDTATAPYVGSKSLADINKGNRKVWGLQ